ncbi:hypothetical protein CAPN008_22830 [Capnocytophaga canis]|uniref:hypothetical protein n=1 Tax=Capnocytophaga canis TaxID=1848903 RepID=UPI001AC6231C|nr:hypothetical protein [Capnocytophaga canis]GIM62233.1 hypothetical protein CAPN008_22830 [Capnocytophaga canis]
MKRVIFLMFLVLGMVGCSKEENKTSEPVEENLSETEVLKKEVGISKDIEINDFYYISEQILFITGRKSNEFYLYKIENKKIKFQHKISLPNEEKFYSISGTEINVNTQNLSFFFISKTDGADTFVIALGGEGVNTEFIPKYFVYNNNSVNKIDTQTNIVKGIIKKDYGFLIKTNNHSYGNNEYMLYNNKFEYQLNVISEANNFFKVDDTYFVVGTKDNDLKCIIVNKEGDILSSYDNTNFNKKYYLTNFQKIDNGVFASFLDSNNKRISFHNIVFYNGKIKEVNTSGNELKINELSIKREDKAYIIKQHYYDLIYDAEWNYLFTKNYYNSFIENGNGILADVVDNSLHIYKIENYNVSLIYKEVLPKTLNIDEGYGNNRIVEMKNYIPYVRKKDDFIVIQMVDNMQLRDSVFIYIYTNNVVKKISILNKIIQRSFLETDINFGDVGFLLPYNIQNTGITYYLMYDKNWNFSYENSYRHFSLHQNNSSGYQYIPITENEVLLFSNGGTTSYIIRADLKNNTEMWTKYNVDASFFGQQLPNDTKYEKAKVVKNGDMWIVTIGYTLRSGKKGSGTVKININNGEIIN